MFKAIVFTAISFFSLASQAQHADLSSLARDVQDLVRSDLYRLHPSEQQNVRGYLEGILYVFSRNGIYPRQGGGGGYPPPYNPGHPNYPVQRNLICDSSNNQLIELGGGMLHDFGSIQNCEEAKVLILRGEPYCDANDNKLFRAPGSLVWDFGSIQNCEEARMRVYYGQNFCDFNDNTLRRADGTLLYDFGSEADCRKGLQ